MRLKRIGSTPVQICVGFLFFQTALAQPVPLVYERVALTGQQAPGAPQGVVFSQLGDPILSGAMFPVIDDVGRVAFVARVSGPGIDPANDLGIWASAGGTGGLVVREGDAASGTPVGVSFASLADGFAFPPRISGGYVAFQATLTGPGVTSANAIGIWEHSGVALTLVVRSNDLLPGEPPARFGAARGAPVANTDGSTTLGMLLRGSPATSDEAIATDLSRQLIFVAHEGEPAPGVDAVYAAPQFVNSSPFPLIAINRTGAMAFVGGLSGESVTLGNDEGLFVEELNGFVSLLIREGDAAPDMDPNASLATTALPRDSAIW